MPRRRIAAPHVAHVPHLALPTGVGRALVGHARVIGATLLVLLVLGGGFFLVRDSSIVAVNDVMVTGVSGPEAAAVRATLTSAAQDMTTLHVRTDELLTAVEPFPVVRGLTAHREGLHRLRIDVDEYQPVAVLVAGGKRVPVADDGTLLRGSSTAGLPELSLRAIPGGSRVSDRRGAQAIALLAAAPAPLRRRAQSVFRTDRGLALRLQSGPVVYFGGAERLQSKWAAATRILADHSSAGATYLDVRMPERPAAGGLEDPTPPSATDVGTGPATGTGTPGPTQPSTTPSGSPAPQVSTTP
jgi:cell division protein FtsQ